MDTNNIDIDDTSSVTSSSVTSSNGTSCQSTPKSAEGGKSSEKITENTFNDKVVLVARAAKDHMRMCVAYGDVFPPTDPAGHTTFIWGIIKQSSQSMPVLQQALREAATSENIKRDLITFTCFYLKLELFSKYILLLLL